MLASKIACPRCQAILPSDRPLPAGTWVKCARCAAAFIVPATTAGPTVHVVTARPAPLANGAAAVPPGPSPPARKVYLPVVFGAAGTLIVVVAVAIVAFVLLRAGKPAPAVDDDEPGPVAKRPRPLIVLTPEEEKKVQEMTSRGVEFLKKAQAPDGFWDGAAPGQHRLGLTAFAALTLLECGLKPDDPIIHRAANFLRDHTPVMTMTYELSLAVLFFNRLGADRDKERIQKLALRLAAGQTPQGGWDYNCPRLSSQAEEQLLAILKALGGSTRDALLKEQPGLLAALLPNLRNLAVLQDTDKQSNDFFRGGGDNSNTQFALLALWTARRQGLPLEPTLGLVARRFQATQNADGTWSYNRQFPNASPTGKPTMTCAGLLGLAVGYALSRDTDSRWGGKRGQRPSQDPAIQKALQVLGQRIGEPRKDPKAPPPPMVEMYYLWSVERVAVLWQLKTIGARHWYQWGMDILAAHQQPDGHWFAKVGHGTSPVLDTCFGLLFLQRVNLAEDLTDKLREIAESAAWLGEVARKD
jgi:hypothetical protein